MALPLAAIPVPLPLTDGGIMRISQTRAMLEVFITALNEGLSTEDLIAEFPEVAVHDVFALLSYYAAHQAAVDAYVEERAAALDSLRDDPAYRAQASRWTELRRRDVSRSPSSARTRAKGRHHPVRPALSEAAAGHREAAR